MTFVCRIEVRITRMNRILPLIGQRWITILEFWIAPESLQNRLVNPMRFLELTATIVVGHPWCDEIKLSHSHSEIDAPGSPHCWGALRGAIHYSESYVSGTHRDLYDSDTAWGNDVLSLCDCYNMGKCLSLPSLCNVSSSKLDEDSE